MTSTAVVNNPTNQRPKDLTRLILLLIAGFFLCLTVAIGSVCYTYVKGQQQSERIAAESTARATAIQQQYDLLRDTQCGQDEAVANLGIVPGGFQTPQGQGLADRIKAFEDAASVSTRKLHCDPNQP